MPARNANLKRLAGAILLAHAGSYATAQAASADAFDGARRVFLDPTLHDLDQRAPADVARVAHALGLEAFLPPQPANTLAVTNCNDSGAGSLRATVASAVSGDTIDLRGLPCATIALSSGPIAIDQDTLTLIGRGASALAIKAGGGKYDNRVLRHSGSGTLLVEGVTISGGSVAGSTQNPSVVGGCILSNGTLALGNALFVNVPAYGVVVDQCSAIANAQGDGLASGGGVYADTLIMADSRISGSRLVAHSANAGFHIDGGGGATAGSRVAIFQSQLVGNTETGSKYGGGGLAVLSTGNDNLIEASTISGNSADFGGGLSISAPATVRNTTVSGNSATQAGAGIGITGIGGQATLQNCTITDNTSSGDSTGAGLYAAGSNVSTLTSTIVWGNFRSTSVPDDVGGSTAPGGSANLIGIASLALPGDTILGIDPHLGPLADNGGFTPTHALRGDSQAIGRGSNPANVSWDQRGQGYPRVVGQNPDIGAFEFSDVIFVDGFEQ